MKMLLKERGIEIVPETDQDKAYIRDTLGGWPGKELTLYCVPPWGLSTTLGYLTTAKPLGWDKPEEA